MIFVKSFDSISALEQRDFRLSLKDFNQLLKAIIEINGDRSDDEYMLVFAEEGTLKSVTADLRTILPADLFGQREGIDQALRLNRIAAAENLFDLLANDRFSVQVQVDELVVDTWCYEVEARPRAEQSVLDDNRYRMNTTAMLGAVVGLAEHLLKDSRGLMEATIEFLDQAECRCEQGFHVVRQEVRLPLHFNSFGHQIFFAFEEQTYDAAERVRNLLLRGRSLNNPWHYSGFVERGDGFYLMQITQFDAGGTVPLRSSWSRPAKTMFNAMIGAAMIAYAGEIEAGRVPN